MTNPMTNNLLLISREVRASGDIEHWTLNEPGSKNALNAMMVLALQQACLRAQADKALRVIVLSGANQAFCSGGSLGGFAKEMSGAVDPLITSNLEFGELLEQLCRLPQVLICVVDGVAMGGGFGLVCCADTVIATDRSVFATPEVTIGVVPAQIAPFVQWRLGDKAARVLMLQGARQSAAQMQLMGLVDEVGSESDLQSMLNKALQAHARAAPAAVVATKELMGMTFFKDLPPVRLAAATAFALQLRSMEAQEGLAAFGQKRKPAWAEL